MDFSYDYPPVKHGKGKKAGRTSFLICRLLPITVMVVAPKTIAFGVLTPFVKDFYPPVHLLNGAQDPVDLRPLNDLLSPLLHGLSAGIPRHESGHPETGECLQNISF